MNTKGVVRRLAGKNLTLYANIYQYN